MLNHLNIIIFIITFPAVCLWLQIKLLFTGLGQNKKSLSTLNNKRLLKLVKDKSVYNLQTIYLLNSNKLFGMMSGVLKPHLILSQKLYQEFNEDETEYVLLHEMGHFLLYHNLKEIIIGVIIILAGATFIVYNNLGTFTSTLLAVVFGVIMIQIARQYEYQADSYALNRMTNPTGMISATNKFQNHYVTPRNKIIEILFYRGNPFANRIKMANAELSKRKTIP